MTKKSLIFDFRANIMLIWWTIVLIHKTETLLHNVWLPSLWFVPSHPWFSFNSGNVLGWFELLSCLNLFWLLPLLFLSHFTFIQVKLLTSCTLFVLLPVLCLFLALSFVSLRTVAKHDASLQVCPEREVIHWRSALISLSLSALYSLIQCDHVYTHTQTHTRHAFRL